MNHGAAPPGVSGEKQTAEWVRGMFGRVAHRYDFLNHFLSLNVDRYWRARTVKRLASRLEQPGTCTLDICCGSGDLTLALEARAGGVVMGSDFCHPMLVEARRKMIQRGSRATVHEADALRMPLADGSVDLITTAFGFRNLASYGDGLAEMVRVLKPGGTAVILEFSRPPNRLIRALYELYSHRILPVIGGVLSGSRGAYRYLPDSVSKFPGPEELADQMRRAGFRQVEYERMTFGIVTLHIGVRD